MPPFASISSNSCALAVSQKAPATISTSLLRADSSMLLLEIQQGDTSCSSSYVDSGPFPSETKEIKVKPKKTVSFYPSATVRLTLHINRYAGQEIEDCWYSDEEYNAMANDIRTTVKIIEDGGDMLSSPSPHLEDLGFTPRGLEKRTKKGSKRRTQVRSQAYKAVLEAQSLQWVQRICDPEALALAYRSISYSSQAAAHALGLQDQQDCTQREQLS